jgi:hypothetical protein
LIMFSVLHYSLPLRYMHLNGPIRIAVSKFTAASFAFFKLMS